MKQAVFVLALLALVFGVEAQTFSTNTTPVGMEHNLLFNAESRYTVTQTGSASFNLTRLFDGTFSPSYTPTGPSKADPTVVTIEGLPINHTQAGAWVGWSTRYWQAEQFLIEGYDEHNGVNSWRVIADFTGVDYAGGRSFSTKIPTGGRYTKLRYTFYTASGADGRLGISELFFIHPEATKPYEGLLTQNGDGGQWSANGTDIYYMDGNVGIGVEDPGDWALAVNGHIRAKEIRVQTDWADFVFDESYDLPSLKEVEQHINEKGHLLDIPSAAEVEKNGIQLGEMNAKLLQKIEELTLYLLQQEKRMDALETANKTLQKEVASLKE